MASSGQDVTTLAIAGAHPKPYNHDLTPTAPAGRTWGAFSLFAMWFFQLVIFLSGMERIRRFIDFCGPVVYVVMFALAAWMLWQTGFSSLSLQLSPPAPTMAATLGVMANAAMLIGAGAGALIHRALSTPGAPAMAFRAGE